jgi:uncharacterized membrane protein YebE (DUF533 family)
MFNAEKLLGQVIGGVLGKGGGKGKNSLMGGLTSGTGLMTAIGLAVGAYEILAEKKAAETSGTRVSAGAVPPPPPPPGGQMAGVTPPMPPVPPVPPPQSATAAPPAPESLTSEDLARRMIQVMIAAACADGTMDEQEEKVILDKLRDIELSQEEKMFMLEELHHPKDIATLTGGIDNPASAKVMYMLAVAAIAIDTEAERKWLDELARGLALSPAIQQFIEEQKEAA